MLTVQITIGSVEADRKNGSSHSKYHGYTTGAHNSDAAIGQANASQDITGLRLSQIAASKPTITAHPTASRGDATCSSAVNIRSQRAGRYSTVVQERYV